MVSKAFGLSKVADSDNTLYVDSSNNRVGIGTTSPDALLTVNTIASFGDGAAGTPSIAHKGDLNTGFWFPAADTIAASTGGSERLRIDSSGNVGIGTTSPSKKLHVYEGAAVVGGTTMILESLSAGYGAGIEAGSALTGGSYKTMGKIVWDGENSWNTTASTQDSFCTLWTTVDGTLTERMRITSGGEVYIAGTTDQGAYNLQVNGTGVWGAGAYVNGSDERLKNNIQTLDSGLDVITALRPVTFQYKEDYSRDQSIQPGFIAQELQQAMTGKNYVDGVVQEGPTYLNVAYQSLIPILTKAIQEQQAQINSLQQRIQQLESN